MTVVNSTPTGSVTISGTPTQNQILTANNTLADADGLGSFNYQWFRDGVLISGATAQTYQLAGADVDHLITVNVSYVDGHGTTESVTSDPTAKVAGVLATPTLNPLAATYDTGASSTDGVTKNTLPTLTGTATANATVQVYDGDVLLGSVKAGSTGNWSFRPATALANGNHALSAQVTDTAGNVSSHSTALMVTVDTLAPTKPVLAVTIPDGTASSGMTIAGHEVILAGSTDAGMKVELLDGTSVLASTYADDAGNYSFGTVGGLVEGAHKFTTRATDVAGNMATSTMTTVTVDTTAPVAPVITGLAAGSDSGASASDGITNMKTPTVAGTGEAGATVRVFDGATLLGTALVGSTGTWSFKIATALPDGAHAITAQAVDKVGNVGDLSAPLNLVVDTTAPVKPTAVVSAGGTALPATAFTNNTSLTVAGSTEANARVDLLEGTTVLGTTTADGSGNYSFSLAGVAEGVHKYTAKAIDTAGNAATSGMATVTVDTSAPLAPSIYGMTTASDSGASSTDGITKIKAPSFTGTAEAGSTVKFYDGATYLGSAVASSTGAWTYKTPNLADGAHMITAQSVDKAGNVSAASAGVAVTIDTTLAKPVFNMTEMGPVNPTGGVANASTSVSLTGTTELGAQVQVFDGTTLLAGVRPDSHGKWSLLLPAGRLADGTHSLTVKVTDVAGNIATSDAKSLLVDNTAPQALFSGIASDGTTSTISGMLEAGATLRVYEDGVQLGAATAGANGAWSIATPQMADGLHYLSLNSVDAAGNQTWQTVVTAATSTDPAGVHVEIDPPGGVSFVGSDYSDVFSSGGGTVNFIDGGKNLLDPAWTYGAGDRFAVYSFYSSYINALDGSATGLDKLAFDAGYAYKLVNGSETDYLKNIEQVDYLYWFDYNGDGFKDPGEVYAWGGNTLALHTNGISVDPLNPANTAWGTPLSQEWYLGFANGVFGADDFVASRDMDPATQALMASWGRGVNVTLGDGNDSAVGSDYGDNFRMGNGVNYVDGGKNLGTTPNGSNPEDVLEIFAPDAASASTVNVVALTSSGSATDKAAYTAGYKFKVSYGSETDYVKNVEDVRVQVFTDANYNGQVDAGELQFHHETLLSTRVFANGGNPADNYQLYTVLGGIGADTFGVATGLTTTQKADLATYGRGVYFDMGAGNDTVTGSDYGDNFQLGAGTNYADGGKNLGSTPWGGQPADSLQLVVTSMDQANAVTVTGLSSSDTGADLTAYNRGYRIKVVNGSEVDYLKNVEWLNEQLWTDSNGNGQMDWGLGEVSNIFNKQIGLQVNEQQVSATDPTQAPDGTPLSQIYSFAYVTGGPGGDDFNATRDISAATKTRMASYQRGVGGDLGAGDDTVVGSDYGDSFNLGAGTNRFDGGKNLGTDPNGFAAVDSVNLFVADQAAANAVSVTSLTASSTGADLTAFNQGYTVRISTATETDYAKNVEQVNINAWQDGNGNGLVDMGEASYVRGLSLVVTSNPIPLNPTDPTMTAWGQPVSSQWQVANVNGSVVNDTFDASTQMDAGSTSMMNTWSRGATFNMGAGDDTVVGTSWGDWFDMGSGTNFVDGGANNGTFPDGGPANDKVGVTVTNPATPIEVRQLQSGDSGADHDAWAAGYQFKVGVGDQTTYMKNVEAVSEQLWTDGNGNGMIDGGETTQMALKWLSPAFFPNSASPSTLFQLGNINGSILDDVLTTADAVVPQSVRDQMAQYQRGLSLFGNDGNDTLVGSAYGDFLSGGTGTNYIDGGTQVGIAPNGNANRDTVGVFTHTIAQAQAVTVTELSGSMAGADLDAFNNGYRFKVVSPSNNEVDYIKNAEALNISTWTDSNNNGIQDGNEPNVVYATRNLGVSFGNNIPSTSNQTPALGYAFGSQFSDVINASDVLAAQGKTFDPSNAFGTYLFSLGGNDVVTGSDGMDIVVTTQYGSHLVNGGNDAGFYYYTAGQATIAQDIYRVFEQRDAAHVPDPNATNGGLNTVSFPLANYRLVDLTQWSGYSSQSLAGLSGTGTSAGLQDKFTNTALSGADVDNIAAQANQLGLTGTGANGYNLAVVKYDTNGTTLLGVDFLKNVELVQTGLWFDSNRNDVANGAETAVSSTSYSVAPDSYTLNSGNQHWLDLKLGGTTHSFAGYAAGSAFNDTLDGSTLPVPGIFAAGTGYRMTDVGGSDNAVATAGNDIWALGAGNDTIDGGAGDDYAMVYWSKPSSTATLSRTVTTSNGITTIAVSQVDNGTTTALFNLVNDGTNAHWTFSTTGSAADAVIRPQGSTTSGVGTDHLDNFEHFAVFASGGVNIASGGNATTDASLELSLVGVVG